MKNEADVVRENADRHHFKRILKNYGPVEFGQLLHEARLLLLEEQKHKTPIRYTDAFPKDTNP